MSTRFPRAKDLVKDGKWTGKTRENEAFLDRIYSRKKSTVFAIWNDLFHINVSDKFIEEVIAAFIDNQRHTGLFLTKRPDYMAAHFDEYGRAPLNIWLGTTVENQEQADKRIPELLKCPGNLWLSIEPMLGPVDLRKIPCGNGDLLFPISSNEDGDEFVCRSQIGAVILGGETGSKARPMNPDWVRKVRDDCMEAEIPFFFKQWGEFIPADQKECPFGPPRKRWIWSDGKPFSNDDVERIGVKLLCRVGRLKAGRVMDSRTHDDLPWRL